MEEREHTTDGDGSAAPLFEVRDLTKSFGEKTILDGISFDIHRGECLVILGRSGSGKSVTLRQLNGLEWPDRGTVTFDGIPISEMEERDLFPVRKRIAMLFQSGALFDSLPVWRNVTFALTRGGYAKARDMRQVALENLERVGLGEDVLDLRPNELSGGMQKRVALARAIAPRPEIVFFDEPTTGLDPIKADVINALIVELVDDLGITAVTITHDMVSATKISHRIAMLYQGRIIWEGPTFRLRESGNPYVDQFVKGQAEGPIV